MRIVCGDTPRVYWTYDSIGIKCASHFVMNLNAYVDETAALLEESQQLNFKRWPILSQRVHQNPKAYGSYAAEVENVKNYITKRLTKFDQLVRNY